MDELPPDQLLAVDQNLDGNGNGFYDPESNPGQTNDEDFDIDIDIKEEDFDNIPYVGGKRQVLGYRGLVQLGV